MALCPAKRVHALTSAQTDYVTACVLASVIATDMKLAMKAREDHDAVGPL